MVQPDRVGDHLIQREVLFVPHPAVVTETCSKVRLAQKPADPILERVDPALRH
jgi:hypothetical protein